jgi:integrase
MGKVKENPAKKAKILKGEVRRTRFILPTEIQRLLSNCADHLKPIVRVALHTGMRKGELLTLKWDQVNLEQGIISLLDTKNHERREVPTNETVKATLKGIERKGDYVFSNEAGGSFVNLRHSFDTAVRKSGITDFRFHDLRHTFASNLVMEGIDIMTVKELMGHKDLTKTLRYAHLAHRITKPGP